MGVIAHRGRFFAVLLALGIAASSAAAPAAVDLSTGIRYAIPSGTVDECGTKAQAALKAYLDNPTEASPGSHEYIATGPIGATGSAAGTSAGTVHCYAQGKGYMVTFTCVVETPNNPYDADSLCLDIAHNFSGKPQKPLATPTPMPTGCTTANLIGTWQSDTDKTLSFKMDGSGNLEASDGVGGNWVLDGLTATITYYGNHTLKLSSDGKHLSGSGYSLTRKC